MSDTTLDLLYEIQRRVILTEADYRALLTRYDDALKRMNDMQAELEYLRQEQARRD